MSEKYPQNYILDQKPEPYDPQKAEILRDSQQNAVLPFGRKSVIRYATLPGSTKVRFGARGMDEGQTRPEDLASGVLGGYLDLGHTSLVKLSTEGILIGANPGVEGGGWLMSHTGLFGYNDADARFQFYLETSGALEPGTLVLGDYDNDQYAMWDQANSQFIVKGTFYATAGLIGGWSISDTALYKEDGTDSAGMVPTDYAFYAGIVLADRATAPFRVYKDGSVTCTNLTVTGGSISGIVLSGLAAGSEPSIQGWQQDMIFSSTDHNTVAWTAGTITLLNGDTFNISPGANTGDITALTYIYFDKTSPTVLQVTTTPANAVGAGKILIAVAEDVAAGKLASYQVFGGTGGINKLWTADSIAANTITANEILANTITASEIYGHTITADQIAVGTITTTEINLLSFEISSTNVSDVDAYSTNQDKQQLSTLLVDTPTGSGLFMDATHLGYYDSPNWKTYMDSSGNFYLGGTSGSLQWVASTDSLIISGTIYATIGTIGGWTLDTLTLKSYNNEIEFYAGDASNTPHLKIFSEGSSNPNDYAQLTGGEDPGQVNVGIPRFDVYRDITETDGNVRTQYGKVLWFYTKYQTVAYDPCPQGQIYTKDGKEWKEDFPTIGSPADQDGISVWSLLMKSTGDAARVAKAAIMFYGYAAQSGATGEIGLTGQVLAPQTTMRLGDYNAKYSQLYLDQLASNPSAPYLVEGLVFTKTDHHIYYYNGSSVVALDSSGGISEVKDDTTPELGGSLDCNSQTLTEAGHIYPSSSKYLGSTTYRWSVLYTANINLTDMVTDATSPASGYLSLGTSYSYGLVLQKGILVKGDILPTAATYDLGSTGVNRWQNLYTSGISLSGRIVNSSSSTYYLCLGTAYDHGLVLQKGIDVTGGSIDATDSNGRIRQYLAGLRSRSAPGSPAASEVYIYYDSADGDIKAKNSSGTVVTIANF